MGPAVAEGAGEGLVLGLGFFELGEGFLVTGAAEGPRRCHGDINFQGVVGRVTAEAVACKLFSDMGLMAVGTVGDAAVDIVAEGAGLLGMSTFVPGKILARPLVAGETRPLDVTGKFQGQRFMGVGVTGEAVFQLKVRLTLVAPGTLGNNLLTPGGVFLVAVETADLRLVSAAVGGDGGRLILVALGAVRDAERRQTTGCRRRKNYSCPEAKQKHRDDSCQKYRPAFRHFPHSC
jgi:hypothetical protein